MVLNHAAERIETGDLQYRIRRGMTDFLSLGARVTGKSETLRKSTGHRSAADYYAADIRTVLHENTQTDDFMDLRSTSTRIADC